MKTEQEIRDHIKELSSGRGDSLTNFITILSLLWVLDNNSEELNQYANMLGCLLCR
jgi:hypothetical protein